MNKKTPRAEAGGDIAVVPVDVLPGCAVGEDMRPRGPDIGNRADVEARRSRQPQTNDARIALKFGLNFGEDELLDVVVGCIDRLQERPPNREVIDWQAETEGIATVGDPAWIQRLRECQDERAVVLERELQQLRSFLSRRRTLELVVLLGAMAAFLDVQMAHRVVMTDDVRDRQRPKVNVSIEDHPNRFGILDPLVLHAVDERGVDVVLHDAEVGCGFGHDSLLVLWNPVCVGFGLFLSQNPRIVNSTLPRWTFALKYVQMGLIYATSRHWRGWVYRHELRLSCPSESSGGFGGCLGCVDVRRESREFEAS